eukprot:9427727-Pyramimonas_sp.AAC.1
MTVFLDSTFCAIACLSASENCKRAFRLFGGLHILLCLEGDVLYMCARSPQPFSICLFLPARS